MDQSDRKLMLFLAENPRMPYRELADRLGVSVQAVHRRIQVLMKMGVLSGFAAGISIRHLGAIPVMVFGRSNTSALDETMKKLGKNEMTSSVLVAGGNYLYVVGLLKGISDLEKYADFVKRMGEIVEPMVGIYSLDAGLAPDFIDGGRRANDKGKLTALDMRIIASLSKDCRKPIADIAKEVRVSSRTISRRLDTMLEEGLVDLVVPMDPTATGDIVSTVHIHIREGASKKDVGARLINQFSPRMWYIRSFTNLPDFLLGIVCTDTMNELRGMLEKIAKDDDVKTLVPNIWYADYIFDTWRDRLLEEKKS
jgi:DNA-binding Lrp family transcriptional regulator